MPRNRFGLLRDRGGKSVENEITTKGPRHVSKRVERGVVHPGGGPYVTSKRVKQEILFRGKLG